MTHLSELQSETCDPFASAAQYYFHRPSYPPAAIRWIVNQTTLDPQARLLDVGCGTGHVCFCFSNYFQHIIGIDPSQPMLDQAKAIALSAGVSSISFRRMKAEDLPADLGAFRLITFGASFHRTEKARVLDLTYDMLEPHGTLALLFPSVPWRGDAPWKRALRDTVQRFTGKCLDEDFEPGEDVVRRSRYGHSLVRDFVAECRWSCESLVGYLKSTSFCSPSTLGSRMQEFERELTETLQKVQPDAVFEDTLTTTVLLAHRRSRIE